MSDLLHSFGTLHPGLVTLHNFPRFLQEFERPDHHFQDLAATDMLRSRELGVPATTSSGGCCGSSPRRTSWS
ncbi:hypothetical protein [Streptomyces sp. NPDC001435]|uniref:hypothetical protein n=1 Tax=Streptomyces sp. NPDC001435 TaxID=3364576 RepID=UPI0036B37517